MWKKLLTFLVVVSLSLIAVIFGGQVVLRIMLNKSLETYNPTKAEKPPWIDQEVIDIDLTINKNGSVKENRMETTWGRASSPEAQCKDSGDYLLVVGSSPNPLLIGDVLWRCKFNLYFDYNGPVVVGEDYSNIKYEKTNLSYRIPYRSEMRSAQLWKNNRLIFSKVLPANPPQVKPSI